MCSHGKHSRNPFRPFVRGTWLSVVHTRAQTQLEPSNRAVERKDVIFSWTSSPYLNIAVVDYVNLNV